MSWMQKLRGMIINGSDYSVAVLIQRMGEREFKGNGKNYNKRKELTSRRLHDSITCRSTLLE